MPASIHLDTTVMGTAGFFLRANHPITINGTDYDTGDDASSESFNAKNLTSLLHRGDLYWSET